MMTRRTTRIIELLTVLVTVATVAVFGDLAHAHFPVAGKQPVRTVPVPLPSAITAKMPKHYPESGSARYAAYIWAVPQCGNGTSWTCTQYPQTRDQGTVGDHSRLIYVYWYERSTYTRFCYANVRVDHNYVVVQKYNGGCA